MFRADAVKGVGELFQRCREDKDVHLNLGHARYSRRCRVQVRKHAADYKNCRFSRAVVY